MVKKAIKTDAVNNLREKIRLASDQKVRIANQKQLNSLRLEVEKQQQYLQEMDEGYPVGYPTAEEIKEQRENLSIIQQEGQRLQALKLAMPTRKSPKANSTGLQTPNRLLQILNNATEIARNSEEFRPR